MESPLTIASSPVSVAETVGRLESILREKNIRIFARIDHSEAAKENGLALRDEVVLVFGDPKVGTLLMQENAQIGFELPLKFVVFNDLHSGTQIAYKEPKALSAEYGITRNQEIINKMSALMANLVNAATKVDSARN